MENYQGLHIYVIFHKYFLTFIFSTIADTTVAELEPAAEDQPIISMIDTAKSHELFLSRLFLTHSYWIVQLFATSLQEV